MIITNEKISILIIEDNPGDAFLLEEVLISNNFSGRNIFIAETIKKAEAIFSSHTPDVIFLDLFLPETKGLETFLIANQLFLGVPIIVMSGLNDTDIALKTVQEGAQDFIIKGNDNPALLVKSIYYSIERKKNIQQVLRSEQEYRLLFDLSPLPIFIADDNLNMIQVNQSFLNVYEYNEADIPNLTMNKLLEQEMLFNSMMELLQSKKPKQVRHITKFNKVLFVEQFATRTTFYGQEVYMVIVKDETEKHYFEQEKVRLITETLEDERARFSRELHDGLAQHLVALNFYVAQLGDSSPNAKEIVSNCQSIIKTSLDQTRAMCYNLTPPELEKGLFLGLASMFKRLSKITTIQFSLMANESLIKDIFDEIDEYSLYRIIQEFVNNSIKHSECTLVTCELIHDNTQTLIAVKDNGKGFDIDKVKKGLGLKNIEQRAISSGVKNEIISKPSEGTLLQIYL